MISNKQFFKIAVACDEIWYNFYIKKFCSPINHPVDYDKYKSKWRNVFIETTKKINQRNYNNLKKAFLEKLEYNCKNDNSICVEENSFPDAPNLFGVLNKLRTFAVLFPPLFPLLFPKLISFPSPR